MIDYFAHGALHGIYLTMDTNVLCKRNENPFIWYTYYIFKTIANWMGHPSRPCQHELYSCS